MLWQRLLFGSLMIAAIVGIIVLDARLAVDPMSLSLTEGAEDAARADLARCALPITLLVVLLVVLGTYEMGRLCREGGYDPVTHWAAFVGVGVVLIPWMEMQRRMGPLTPLASLDRLDVSPAVIWLVGGLLGTCLTVLSRRTAERAIGNMAVTILLFLYVGLLASFVVRLRCLWPGPAGSAMVVYFILTVKAGDIGAYFTGLAFGRHKLIPWLSPGKTIEGAVGAVVFAAGVAAGAMRLWPSLSLGIPAPLSLAQALSFGIVMAITGHMGDLVESAFKRDVRSKDSGRLIPAFGGILDLVDSPLFTAPIAWVLVTFWTAAG